MAAVRDGFRKAPPGTDRLELVGVAYEALVRARRRYNAQTGVPFGAYAKIRVRGAVMDAVRRLWSRVEEIPTAAPEAGAVEAPEAVYDVKQLSAALRRLEPRDRLIFGLYYEADLNLKQVAEIIGLSSSHVWQLLRAIRAEVQKKIDSAQKSDGCTSSF